MYTLEKYYYNIIQIHGFSLRILVNIHYTLSKVQTVANTGFLEDSSQFLPHLQAC